LNVAHSFPGSAGPMPALDAAAEAAREAVRETYGIEGLQDDPELTGITRFAAELFDTPISLVSLLIGETQHFLARQGTDETENPRSTSFCSHAMVHGGVMEVRDATLDPRFLDNPLVTGEPMTLFQRAAITADTTNQVCHWGTAGAGYINADVTMTLTRLPVGYEVGMKADNVYAEATSTLVAFDVEANRLRRFTPKEREFIGRYLAPPSA